MRHPISWSPMSGQTRPLTAAEKRWRPTPILIADPSMRLSLVGSVPPAPSVSETNDDERRLGR
jgi:hypothetical protein